MKNPAKVNIRQTAEYAGVSPATVSRVLNGNTSVDTVLARRVMEAVEKLGYQSKGQKHRQNKIVLILPQIVDTYYCETASGILDAARESGYSVITMLSNFDIDQERACLRAACAADTAGIILTPITSKRPQDIVPELERIPMVVTGPRHISDDIVHVHMNNAEAAYITTRYLLRLGRRNIAFIATFWLDHIKTYDDFWAEYNSPARGSFSVYDWFDGYCRALAEVGLSPNPNLIAFGGFSYESGYNCARHLLSSAYPDQFDSIIVPNDRSGAGVLKLLGEQGFRVPDQISIACLNGGLTSEIVTPALTTIETENYKVGTASFEQLMHLIKGEPAQDVLLAPHLLIRTSTQMLPG